ncbi:MAG: septum formation initiator family protein [Acinetobacter sp.]|nr:septum formation initiator family protein [Acinetobacter sp.]
MSSALKTTAQLEAQLSPQQKKLNRLIERIEQQKQELAAWKNAQADIQNYTRSKLYLFIESYIRCYLYSSKPCGIT